MTQRSVSEDQTALIAATALGTTEVVAAQGAGRRIVMEVYVFTTDGDIVIKFQSSATDLTGDIKPGVNGVVSSNVPIVCAVNEALNINLSANAIVGGHCSYRVEEVIS